MRPSSGTRAHPDRAAPRADAATPDAATPDERGTGTTAPPEPPPLWWQPVAALGVLVTGALLLLSGRYDYDADELYFRLTAEHLAWGYVDQPPAVPALARLQIALFGDHVTALRVLPALLAGVTLVLVALIARELGGSRAAQLLAATATALSAFPVAMGHVLWPATVDLVVWLVMSLLAIRMLRTGRDRYWLGIGITCGVGLYAKNLVALLVLGLVGGILLAGDRRLLRSRYLLAGAGLAVLVAAPVLVWQFANGLPQLRMAATLSSTAGDLNRVVVLPFHLLLVIGPLLVAVWVAGLVALLRGQRWRPYRAVGVAYLVVLALVVLANGRHYYPAGLQLVLLAAGSVVAVRWARGVLRRALLALALGGNLAFTLVFALPVLPAPALGRIPLVQSGLAMTSGQIGWQRMAEQVADVYRSLPPRQRGATVIYTDNYGPAGALARYGPRHGLPVVYSGHNSLHGFAVPPDDRTTVIALEVDVDGFGPLFDRCESRAVVDNGVGMQTQDQGQEIYLCQGMRQPWSQVWPRLRRVGP